MVGFWAEIDRTRPLTTRAREYGMADTRKIGGPTAKDPPRTPRAQLLDAVEECKRAQAGLVLLADGGLSDDGVRQVRAGTMRQLSKALSIASIAPLAR